MTITPNQLMLSHLRALKSRFAQSDTHERKIFIDTLWVLPIAAGMVVWLALTPVDDPFRGRLSAAVYLVWLMAALLLIVLRLFTFRRLATGVLRTLKLRPSSLYDLSFFFVALTFTVLSVGAAFVCEPIASLDGFQIPAVAVVVGLVPLIRNVIDSFRM